MLYEQVSLLPPLICLFTQDEALWAKSRPLTRRNTLWHVAGVGSVNNTFGIKGVAENTFFFKSIDDANRLRRQVSECFERASLPQASQEVCREHHHELSAHPEGSRSIALCARQPPLSCWISISGDCKLEMRQVMATGRCGKSLWYQKREAHC